MAWSGEASGGMFEFRHRDNEALDPEDQLFIDDEQDYQGHFTFSFHIQPDGSISGTGKGEYDKATWHLQGTNGGEAVNCDPPLTAEPFTVDVSGSVSGRTIKLGLDLPDARESNESEDCGGDFTAFGGTTKALRDSLAATGGGEISFDMSTLGSKTLEKHEQTSEGEYKQIIRDHKWTVSVKHDCAESDYDDPANTEYINQYAAGETLDLPNASAAGGGKAGGNACGPSSLAMFMNAAKEALGDPDRADLKTAYTETMTSGFTQDGENNLFSWSKGATWSKSKGFDATSGSGIVFINNQLAGGSQVLVSSRFSAKARTNANPYGGGHVILITGRTPDGDYIVSDPSGDYMSSDTGHYGKDKCGSNVVYPEDIVEDRVENADGTGRAALGINSKPGADPRFLLLIGWFDGLGPSPYNLWVEDGDGNRAGFLPSSAVVQEIPTSEAMLDAQYPSDPDLPAEEPNPLIWPQAVSLEITEDLGDLTMFVEGDRESDYRVEVYVVENGHVIRDEFEEGHITTGEERSFELETTPSKSRISQPRHGSRVEKADLAFKGTATDADGIKLVRYSLQSSSSGRYYDPGTKKFDSDLPIFIRTSIETLSARKVSWKAKPPNALRTGKRYVLRVAGLDKAGNLEVVYELDRNLARFKLID